MSIIERLKWLDRQALMGLKWLGRHPDVINAAASAATVVVAVSALFVALAADRQASRTADAQRAFQKQVEERQSAPVLAPGVEPELTAKRVTVASGWGTVANRRAERLMFVSGDEETGAPARVVMPMRNVGEGVAVVPGQVVLTETSCQDRQFRAQERGSRVRIEKPTAFKVYGTRYLGPYNIPPGESQQLAFELDATDPESYLWKGDQRLVSLRIAYTDLLGRRLRSTCVDYRRGRRGSWSVFYPFYNYQGMK